jgi:tetratricopeptide (TPR) repeat protein
VVVLAAAATVSADWWFCLPDDARATYVGRQACVDCHREACEKWTGSHHDLAMDRATPETVLADFNDVVFEHHGVRSRMYRRDGQYLVHTEGPDGKMADFEVKYTLGVDPLQNYMVEFDRPPRMPEAQVARLQVLRLAWDTRRQRWFYMPPPDARERLSPDDPLHWTGIMQRWNNMCADCHSTNVAKNFDVASQTYHTTFSEIDVSCEACHGPASLHVQLANSRSLFWDRKRGFGLVRFKDRAETQIQMCAPCHSRRRVVYPGFQPGDNYRDFYDNEMLDRTTYHADGQILDEVFEYASFVQSKMYHRGIRCTDCHDPHSAKLKHTANETCTSCHQHPAGKYDGPAHHHHQPGSRGALCVECHMPQTTYMEVHARRDHSLRLPRPDLSVALGTPNACSRCHLYEEQAKLAQGGGADGGRQQLYRREELRQYLDWILAARRGDQPVRQELARLDGEMHKSFLEWYGDKPRDGERRKHFAFALDAARRGDPAADQELIGLVRNRRLPDLVRATATFDLGQYANDQTTQVLLAALADPAPQVRTAAIGNLAARLTDEQGGHLPGRLRSSQLQAALLPLLSDPVRAARLEAARALAPVAGGERASALREQLQQPLAEFTAGLLLNNDRAGAHMTLAGLHEARGEVDRAIGAYQTALDVEPRLAGPRSHLAALFEQRADVSEFEAQRAARLRESDLARRADEQAASYRQRAQKLRREELELLARDAKLAPDAASVQYRYGMALYLQRRLPEAERALLRAHQLEPNAPQFLLGIVLYYKERRRPAEALPLAEKLVQLRPEDPVYRQVRDEIRAQLPAKP